MTQILYAKPVINASKKSLKLQTKSIIKNYNIIPTLKVVLVGENPASVIYTTNKKVFCEKIGARCEIIKLEQDCTETLFMKTVNELNADKDVHGVLIQLPLPAHLSHIDTTNLVAPSKDVDGFHLENISKLYRNDNSGLIPCTPKGILTLAKFYNIDFSNKNVLIIGRSLIVGKPLSLLLTSLNATVTLAHSKTKNLKDHCLNSDIIISACGKPNLINKEHIRNNQTQVVIDVGINRLPDGSLSGDCNFEEIKDSVAAITPVPGGVGPMTIFSVAQNLLQALENII